MPILWFIKNKINNSFLKKSIKYYQWSKGGANKEIINAESFSYFLGLCLGDGHICSDKSMINFFFILRNALHDSKVKSLEARLS